MRRTVLGTACMILMLASTALAQQTVGNYVRRGGAPLSQYGPQQPGYIAPAARYTGQQPQQPGGAPAVGPQQAAHQQPPMQNLPPGLPQRPVAQSIYNQSHLQPNMVHPAHGGMVPGSAPMLQVNRVTGRQEIRPPGPLPPSSRPHTHPYFMGRSKGGSFVTPVAGALPGQSVAQPAQPAEAAEPERTWKYYVKMFFWPW